MTRRQKKSNNEDGKKDEMFWLFLRPEQSFLSWKQKTVKQESQNTDAFGCYSISFKNDFE